jgi:hypothetical protein
VESLVKIETELHAAERNKARASWRIDTRETPPVWVASLPENTGSYEEAEGLFAEIERRIGEELLAGNGPPCGTLAPTMVHKSIARHCAS